MEPSSDIVLRTSGVRAVGEKMARAPDWRRTVFYFLFFCYCQRYITPNFFGGGEGEANEPTDCAAATDFEFAIAVKWRRASR